MQRGGGVGGKSSHRTKPWRSVHSSLLLEDKSLTIDTNMWQNGIYFVEIANSTEKVVRKLIIQQ